MRQFQPCPRRDPAKVPRRSPARSPNPCHSPFLKYGLNPAHRDAPQLRWQPEFKKNYDVIIIGAGGHGLATAYYLASRHGISNIAVLDKAWLGGGNTARNTTIIRANYLTPEGVAFYKESVELFRGLSEEVDINIMYSERGHFTLAHTDAAMRTARWRAEVNKHLGVDSEVIDADEVGRLCPTLNMSEDVRYPILGALYHPPGALARHDAVAWGYAKGAMARGVEVHPGTEVTGILKQGNRAIGVETDRGTIHAGKIIQAVAGSSSRVSALAGLSPADQDDSAAGLRLRAGQADPRPDRRLRLAACLHLAKRARRNGHGRRRPTLTVCTGRARRSISRRA